MQKIIACIVLLFAICLFLFRPDNSLTLFNTFCVFVYVFNVFIYFKIIHKSNFFDFDTMFFLTYFLVVFYYLFFLIGSKDLERYFMFQYPFDLNSSSHVASLGLLGQASYIFGGLFFKNVRTRDVNPSDKIFDGLCVNNYKLYLAALVSFTMYIILGGYKIFLGSYADVLSNEGGVQNYFLLFTPVFLSVAWILEMINLKNRFNCFKIVKVSKLGLFSTLLFIVSFIIFGSRTPILQICILLLGCYSIIFKQVSFFKFIGLLSIGILGMFLIRLTRSGESAGDFIFSDLFLDLIIINRVNFVMIEYTDINGYTMGVSMLSPILSVVPFLQTIVSEWFKVDPINMSSSLLYTQYTLGNTDLGLGTSILADIYFSFGALGVILFMMWLGRYVNKLHMQHTDSIYALVKYLIIFSFAVFIVRAEFFVFLRMLVWGVIILHLVLKYEKKTWIK